jgi:ribosomal protein S6--L-glutamate ligase
MEKTIIGCEEWLGFPDFSIPAIKARIDSGAKTSSLHAFNINPYEENGKTFVKFDVHPIQNNRKIKTKCKAEVVDRRSVKSSSGESEKRYVIRTELQLQDKVWDAEVTLTNRDNMGYRMLLGREAMKGKLLVDPERHFVLGDYTPEEFKKLFSIEEPKNKRLKIGLLASDPKLYSNRRIMEAGILAGHNMVFINTRQCYMNISQENSAVYYRGGESLSDLDAIIPRIRPSLTAYGCSVIRHFENLGMFCLNDSTSIGRSRDKLRALQIMANKGIDIPITGFADSPLDTKDLINMVGGAPLVVKLLEGTQGKGVVLAETKKAAESVINALKSLKANILVQELIKESIGTDLRCFVVDNKVVGAIERKAAEGEFRANIHLGGTASETKITTTEKKMAIKASKVLGLKVAGVDILRSTKGPKVIEVNSSPGLEGIETALGKDIASLMIRAIEKQFD